MIGWIIALIVIGLISIILLSSVKIELDISEKVFFEVSILGIRLFKFSSEKSNKAEIKIQNLSDKKDKTEKKSKLVGLLKDYSKSKKKTMLIKELLELLKSLCIKFMVLIKHIRFKKVNLDLTVSSTDAAGTAILYGSLCSVVYSIISLLDCAIKFSPDKLSVRTDFTAEDCRLTLNGIIKIRILFILAFVISTAFSIIKIKIGDIKNGRT